MEKTFVIGQVIKESWEAVKKNLKFFVLLALMAWIAQFIPSYINGQITNTTAGLIVSLVSWLVNSAVTVALITITLKWIRQGKAEYRDGVGGMNRIGAYLLGSIYYSLIVFVGIILLIVPGIIWAIKYQFYGYLIVDQGMKPKEALAKSKQMTQGKIGQLLLLGLALMGVNLIGVLLLGVGLLVTLPLSLIAVAKVYVALLGQSGAKTTATSGADAAPNMWKTIRQS